MPDPLPSAHTDALTSQENSRLRELLGDVPPATNELLASLAQSVQDRRTHEHPTYEDFYCVNLSSWSGDRTAFVLRRLLDTETENQRLRQALAAIARLHTDSPAGPCPVCINPDDLAAAGDGLIAWPCPTAVAAGIEPDAALPDRLRHLI